jgi:hypothetical protein
MKYFVKSMFSTNSKLINATTIVPLKQCRERRAIHVYIGIQFIVPSTDEFMDAVSDD